MARRKPRKNVGPQPHHGPKKTRRADGAQGHSATGASAPKRRPGQPHPASFQGVAIRAAIVSALFYPYLVYIAKEDQGRSAMLTGVAFLMMLPIGLFMDRLRYRRQMARWNEKHGVKKPAKQASEAKTEAKS